MNQTSDKKDKKQSDLNSVNNLANSLIHFLDSEIEHIKNEQQQPGWTKWAISGSLATSAWLLLNEIEKTQISLYTVIGLLIGISLFSNLISTLQGLLVDLSSLGIKGRYFTTSQLAKNRLNLIIILARYIVVICLTYFLSDKTSKPILVASYSVNIWFLLNYLAIITLSFFNVPIPSKLKMTGWLTKLTPVITILITAFATIGYFYEISAQPLLIVHIRIAGLIATTYFLIVLISKISINSPLLESLINIRRELSLGHLDYKLALEQTDIVIAGLKISNVLQEYVGNILTLLDELNSKMQKVSLHVNAMEKVQAGKKDNFSEEQQATIMSLKSSIVTILVEAREILQIKIPSALKPFRIRVEIIEKFSDGSDDEIEKIQNTIASTIENATSQVDLVLDKMNLLIFTENA